MTRLELIVQQLGKEPLIVPLGQPIVVGRSRRADVTIEDEEVGREQFRIGLENGKAVIEGLGTTNQTLVDGSVLPSGQKRTLPAGSAIRVGRTTFTIRNEQPTEGARPGGVVPDATLVSPRPTGPKSMSDSTMTPPEERTGGSASPMRTMPGIRPGGGPISPPPKPPTAAAPPSMPPRREVEPEQTMQLKGGPGYRPGQAAPPPEEPARPARPAAQVPPVSPPPPTPATPPVPPTPLSPEATVAAPRRPAPRERPPAPAEPAPPARANNPSPLHEKVVEKVVEKPVRPVTLAVHPVDLAAEIGKSEIAPTKAVDIEARLHQALPRLFVKCEGMKRRVRLMKARNMLGRAESVDVLLPNESVSEQHAEIMFDGTTFVLRDRGSTNGSFVDGGHLRGGSQELHRHSIIGLGIVRAIFLCNDRRNVGGQRRLEERAMQLLVRAGRLPAEAGREALRVARADASQSIAELLLMDTPLSPAEWATAITTARSQRSFLDSARQLIERLRRNRRSPKAP